MPLSSKNLRDTSALSVSESDPEMSYQPLAQLSTRELEILTLVVKGLTNRQIADELFITPKTADNHVHNILYKLGLSNRTKAATAALLLGLVTVRLDEITHDLPL